MKTTYWIATILLFLFEGLMPALTGHTELAVQGILHLGYPDYFGPHLNIMKVMGATAILLPMVKGRLKEWAYAGLFFDFVWAFISHGMVDGFGHPQTWFVLAPTVIWAVSYITYHKLQAAA